MLTEIKDGHMDDYAVDAWRVWREPLLAMCRAMENEVDEDK